MSLDRARARSRRTGCLGEGALVAPGTDGDVDADARDDEEDQRVAAGRLVERPPADVDDGSATARVEAPTARAPATSSISRRPMSRQKKYATTAITMKNAMRRSTPAVASAISRFKSTTTTRRSAARIARLRRNG